MNLSSRVFRTMLLLSAALALLVLSGCGPTPETLYPEFSGKKASIQQSMLLTDFVVLDGTVGDTAIVNIAENKAMAIALMDEVGNEINGKGYPLQNRLLSSMGLPLNPGTHARVIQTREERELDEDRLALQRPPFYLFPVFERDSVLLHLLASFYSALLNSTKLEGQPNAVIKEAIPLGKTMGGGTWFVLLTTGYNIPVGREFGIEPPPLRGQFDMLGMYRSTQIMMMLYVIDTESGELVWADQIHEKQGIVHLERLLRVAGKMTSSLP